MSASLPSLNNAFTSSKCSRVLRYTIELEPQELFPTIPPIIARLAVDVSGANIKPCGFKNIFNSSRITPGCTRTHVLSLFNSIICVKFFETSTTIPLPTTCPASEVPAVLGIIEVLLSRAKAINFFISSLDFGIATANGISRYADASVAYKIRIVSSTYNSPSSSPFNFSNSVFIL